MTRWTNGMRGKRNIEAGLFAPTVNRIDLEIYCIVKATLLLEGTSPGKEAAALGVLGSERFKFYSIIYLFVSKLYRLLRIAHNNWGEFHFGYFAQSNL
jgi:hypothetical protein